MSRRFTGHILMAEQPQYVSDKLFHFVGHAHSEDHEKNFATLKAILQTGWILHRGGSPGWGQERISISPTGTLINERLIVPEVVCFCDIPEEALGIHVAKYGQFGLSLSRQYAQRYGARPVLYFPLNIDQPEMRYGTPCLSDIEAVFRSLRNHLRGIEKPNERTWGQEPTTLEHAADAFASIALKEFLAFVKPFDGQLPATAWNNYYMEREWRRLGNMEVNEQSVRSIIIPAAFGARARAELGPYSEKVRILEDVVLGHDAPPGD